MAELGLCSRREADDWIARGWVRVNGAVAVMGLQVAPDAEIEIDRAAQGQQDSRVTMLLHKPVGYVSGQAEDGHEPAVALVNPRSHWREDLCGLRFTPPQLRGLAPAGRLDIDSTGLLVLTQDGRVARQLIGEDSGMEKEYLVRVTYTPDGSAHGPLALNVQAAFPPELLERLAPRPEPGRPAAQARAGGLAKPRAAALCADRRQETPDPPHVRIGGPEGGGPQAHPHRPGGAGQPAGGAVALPRPERAVLAAAFDAAGRALKWPPAPTHPPSLLLLAIRYPPKPDTP